MFPITAIFRKVQCALPAFVLYVMTAQAQHSPVDSVLLTRLTFASVQEREVYHSVYKGESQAFFHLMLYADTGYDEQKATSQLTALEGHIDQIAKYKKGHLKKDVEHLFDALHDSYLKEYQTEARFHEIFRSGTYNCLTASMFYAEAMDRMAIPYALVEMPTHVYVLADPFGQRIMMETTDPVDGVYVPDKKFRERYIRHLCEQKIVRKEQWLEVGTDSLFNLLFYSSDHIGKKEVVGLHYYNLGYYAFSDNDLGAACNNFRKAYLLYPSEEALNSLKESLRQRITQHDYADLGQVGDLVDLFNFIEPTVQNEAWVEEYAHFLCGLFLEKQHRPEYLDSIYELCMQEIIDPTLRAAVAGPYHMERARHHVATLRFSEAMPHLLTAMGYYPENAKLNLVFLELVFQALDRLKAPETYVEYLDSLVAAQPILQTSIAAQTARLYVLLSVAQVYFKTDRPDQGDALLAQFEEARGTSKTELIPEAVAPVYEEAWRAAVRKNQMARARVYIEQGLKHSPNNTTLLHYLDYHE